jgi:Nif-specific regulatory protein
MQQTSRISQAYLVIHLGGRWTDILRLQPGQNISIGRSSENQIVVREDRVSRKHAQIIHHNGGWSVADLGSRNGTQVGGRSIDQALELRAGDIIVVGSCRILFTDQPNQAFSHSTDSVRRAQRAAGQAEADGKREPVETSMHPAAPLADQDGEPPAITSRLSHSQWSAELDPAEYGDMAGSEKWSFFYRLIFDLVACSAAEQAAELALDRLLTELGVSAGGVVRLDTQPASSKSAPLKSEDIKMAVLAARQAPGSSYHRASDHLVNTVVRERQAILARNLQDEPRYSVAQPSGQLTTTSILCAPLRNANASDQAAAVMGLLHVYTQASERMLTTADLHIVAGVADNLAIALSRLETGQRLLSDLDDSRRKIRSLQQELEKDNELIGRSAALQQIQKEIRRAAPTAATILIRGESGVGKELVARAIHRASPRSEGPMVCLNCAALAPTLLESELFGHEKGAFTGATERKIGKFEAAHRGTLLMDEIGEMPHELQAKFLRVLEGHPFERLGGNTPIHTDVRVIAATNRDLEEAVRANLFRSDLYFRLRVVEIHVPPLRQRREDIPILVEHFLTALRPHAHRKLLGVQPEAMELLMRHDWSGNVRELRNVIERAVVLGTDITIGISDLSLSPISVKPSLTPTSAELAFQPSTLEQLEKAHILATLEHVGGNKSKAAQLLGIERSTLDRKLKRY